MALLIWFSRFFFLSKAQQMDRTLGIETKVWSRNTWTFRFFEALPKRLCWLTQSAVTSDVLNQCYIGSSIQCYIYKGWYYIGCLTVNSRWQCNIAQCPPNATHWKCCVGGMVTKVMASWYIISPMQWCNGCQQVNGWLNTGACTYGSDLTTGKIYFTLRYIDEFSRYIDQFFLFHKF
jgi:hypothetical protein